MLAGLRIEAVVENRIGGVLRWRGFNCRIADAYLPGVSNTKFAPDLQRDAGETLVRAHVDFSPRLHVRPRAASLLCELTRRAPDLRGIVERNVYPFQ